MTLLLGFVLGVLSSVVAGGILRLLRWALDARTAQRALDARLLLMPSKDWVLALPSGASIPDVISGGSVDARETLNKLGAVEIDTVRVRVQVKALTALQIVDCRPYVVQRLPQITDARIVCPSAGADERLTLFFDLDEDTPLARQALWEFGVPRVVGDRPYFENAVITLLAGEPFTIDIVASSSDDHVRFGIELCIRCGRHERWLRVPCDGSAEVSGSSQPFERDVVWAWHRLGQVLPENDPRLLIELDPKTGSDRL